MTKAVSMLLVLLTVFSFTINIMPKKIEAAILSCRVAGEGEVPAFYYHPGAKNLPKAFSSHNKYVNLYWIGGVGGIPVYCVEITNHTSDAGSDYTSTTSPISSLSGKQRSLLSIALAYGYSGKTRYGGNKYQEQIATQIVIWMITTGYYNFDTKGNAILDGFSPNAKIGTIARKLLTDIHEYSVVPSFSTSATSSGVPLYEMEWDEDLETYKVILTDENKVLDKFTYTAPEGISVAREENKLTITGAPSSDTIRLSSQKKVTIPKTKVIYLERSSYQKLAYKGAKLNDPVKSTFELKVKGGTLKLIKKSEDNIVKGLKFKVTCENLNYEKIIETDENGGFEINNLKKGTYVIEEVETPYRYKETESITIELLDGGRVNEVSFENFLKEGKVKIKKLSDNPKDMIAQGLYNKPLAGAKYGIYRSDNDKLITTMTTSGVMGEAESEVIKYQGNGKFYIKEISPPKYYAHDDTKYYFTLTKDYEIFPFEVKNKTLIGKMTVSYKEIKTSEDAPKTGDNNNIYLYVIITGIAGAMLLLLLLVSKKKKNEETKDLSGVIKKVKEIESEE